MGHNLNLLHSGGLDGQEYTDHTGVMGNGFLIDGAVCFNAAKSWELGWYDDKALTLDVATTPSWNGRLVGVAEYQHENIMSSDNVLVKITDGGVVTASETYFIAFNRKTGINRDSVTGGDQVNIVKAEADGGGQSYLVATLAQSESYTIIGYTEDFTDLIIQVEAIDIAGLDVPGHAIVTIEVSEEPDEAELSSNPEELAMFNGTATDGKAGKSVAINRNGTRIALGAPDDQSGSVRVYDMIGGDWSQVGGEINGGGTAREFGYSMDMNESGDRIVIGSPGTMNGVGNVYVYELDGGVWVQLGNVYLASSAESYMGFSVTMNNVGNKIAYGAPKYNSLSGLVQASEYVNGTWVAMGNAFEGNYYVETAFGKSIAMDGSGNRIIMGAEYAEEGYGQVYIYDYTDATDTWGPSTVTDRGRVTGDSYYGHFGSDVDISEDGNRVVVGADAFTSGSTSNVGEVSVYEYTAGDWIQLGSSLLGDIEHEKFGQSVSMSGDGNNIAVSSPGAGDANCTGVLNGKVQAFSYSSIDDKWLPVGDEIQGVETNDRLGEEDNSIAFDRTGSRLVAGAQRGNYYEGWAKVYQYV